VKSIKNIRWVPLLPACVLALSATSARAEDATAGRELYSNYCLGCHGSEAAGLSAFQGDLATFRERLGNTANMPDMSGLLTEQEAAEVFAYLQSTRTR
jgi:mono/diheme cytochrome c family protein